MSARAPDPGGCHVTAGRLLTTFGHHCRERGYPFTIETSVRPPDGTTLFCSAGMQRLKSLFLDAGHFGTLANVQTCLRAGDLDEIGDGTHRIAFRMLGLFSFRTLSLREAIRFWMEYLDRIGLPPDHVTVHPDMAEAWTPLHEGRVPVLLDPECRWSDGIVEGYCTEFYRDGVEIGNIVNPLGTCIDCGFGLDRLGDLIDRGPPATPADILREGIEAIVASGYAPGPKGQGYVLRRLLRMLAGLGEGLDHPFMRSEIERQDRARARYSALVGRHPGMPASWWWDTHGVDVGELGAAPASPAKD